MKEVIVIKVTTQRTETIHYHPDRDFHGSEVSLKQIAKLDAAEIEKGTLRVDDLSLVWSEGTETEKVETGLHYVEHEEEDEWDD